MFLVKVYAVLDTPGSELMTVSCIDPNGWECEMRFDEQYAISIGFRRQTDGERVEYAKEHIMRAGGFERLRESFRAIFPKAKA